MKQLHRDLKYLLPAWLGCALLPLLTIIFWHSDDNGVPWPYFCFFIACTGLVAYAFRRDVNSQDKSEQPKRKWLMRMTTVGGALFLACLIFSSLCVALNVQRGFLGFFLTFLIIIPPICIVPYFTLVTRNSLAGVMFTLFLVFCMKLLGCVVVVIVYGWHADIHGHTTLPWTHPNLLVWLFWLNTAVLSVSFYFLGKKRFMRDMNPTNTASIKSN